MRVLVDNLSFFVLVLVLLVLILLVVLVLRCRLLAATAAPLHDCLCMGAKDMVAYIVVADVVVVVVVVVFVFVTTFPFRQHTQWIATASFATNDSINGKHHRWRRH